VILVDTSVWLDHMRQSDASLARYISEKRVLMHSLVIGEIAMGALAQRDVTLEALQQLPHTITAYDEEVLRFVADHKLWGAGIGYADAHLLVSVQLTAHCTLWTRDKRLRVVAEKLSLAWPEPKPQ
jgi:predicted nucleic acid-binding protein